jgi:hypothetical protein
MDFYDMPVSNTCLDPHAGIETYLGRVQGQS